MTNETLKKILSENTEEKQKLLSNTFADEIEAEVEAFRQEVVAKYETKKQAEIQSLDCRIKLLEELVEMEEKEEATILSEEQENTGDDING